MRKKGLGLWPLAATLLLLIMSAVGAVDQLTRHSSPETDLSLLKARLHGIGNAPGMRSYLGTLARYQPEHTLYLQLHDRDGQVLATWPAPLSQRTWGMLAPWLQTTRMRILELVSFEERYSLQQADGVLGDLLIWRTGSVAGMTAAFWVYLVSALVALLGAMRLLLSHQNPAAAAAGGAANSRLYKDVPGIAEKLDQTDCGLVVLDAQGLMLNLNRIAQAWTGWGAEDAKGLPATSVLKLLTAGGSDDIDPLLPAWQGNAVLRARTGSDRPVHAVSVQLQDLRTTWLLWDRSEEAATFSRLRQEAELAAKTLDYMGEGLAILDRYGRVTRANQRMYELFQYPEGELIGLSLAKLMPVPFLNEPDLSLEAFSGQADAPKVVAWRADASTFSVELHAYALAEHAQQWLILLRDTSERALQENRARRLQSLLQAAPSGVLVLDSESQYVNDANPAAQQLLTKSLSDLKRMRLRHFLPQLTVDEIAQMTEELCSGSAPYREFESSLNVSDQARRCHVRVVWSADEDPPVWLVYLRPLSSD